MNKCRSCNAEIVWGVTDQPGKRARMMPLDPEPRPDGNVVKTGRFRPDGAAFVVVLAKGETAIGDRYVSHFATCPQAKSHRRG